MRSRYSLIIGALLLAIIGFTTQFGYAQSKPVTGTQNLPSTSVLFENVRIFNGTSEQLSAPSNVLVVDNKIETISTASIAAPSGANLTRINGNGRVLMPGLIDNHTHLFMTLSTIQEGLDPNINPQVLEQKAQTAANDMLLRGFTTARDMGGPVFTLKKAIDTGKSVGPRIYPSGAPLSQTSGHGDFRSLSDCPEHPLPLSIGQNCSERRRSPMGYPKYSAVLVRT